MVSRTETNSPGHRHFCLYNDVIKNGVLALFRGTSVDPTLQPLIFSCYCLVPWDPVHPQKDKQCFTMQEHEWRRLKLYVASYLKCYYDQNFMSGMKQKCAPCGLSDVVVPVLVTEIKFGSRKVKILNLEK